MSKAAANPGASEKKAKSLANLNRGLGKNQGRDASGKIVKLPAPEKPLRSDQSKNVLDVFQWVLTRPAEMDETYEQRNYREWLEADRKGFMAERHRLEKTAGGLPGVPGETPGIELDENIGEMLGEEWARLERFRESERARNDADQAGVDRVDGGSGHDADRAVGGASSAAVVVSVGEGFAGVEDFGVDGPGSE